MAAVKLLLDYAVVLIAAEIGGTVFWRLRMPRALGIPDLLAIAMTVMIGTALLPSPILAVWQRRAATAEPV